jgi:integrase
VRGHIAKKGNKYYIVISLKDEVTGKRKVKWLSGKNGKGFDRKKDAEREMPEILASIMAGTFASSSGETFGDLMTKWLQDKRSTVRYNTWKSYAWLVNLYLIPYLGNIKPDKLKPAHFHELYHEILSDKLSSTSIRKLHTIVVNALNRAVTWGKISRNVAAVVELPKKKRTTFEVWNEQQLDTFLAEAKDSIYYVLFHVAANTGMRQSELLGLKWSDVDFENKTISVRQALTLDEGGGYSINNTKSVSSERSIALFPDTVELLKQHYDQQLIQKQQAGELYKDRGLVFQTSTGKPIVPQHVRRVFQRILKRLQVKWTNGSLPVHVPIIRFHDLRHTHATLLLKKGVHPKIVQERLGHSSITMTLDTYSHVLPNLQQAVLNGLGNSITSIQNENVRSL